MTRGQSTGLSKEIVRVIRTHGSMKSKTIRNYLPAFPEKSVSQAISRLYKNGTLSKLGGVFSISDLVPGSKSPMPSVPTTDAPFIQLDQEEHEIMNALEAGELTPLAPEAFKLKKAELEQAARNTRKIQEMPWKARLAEKLVDIATKLIDKL